MTMTEMLKCSCSDGTGQVLDVLRGTSLADLPVEDWNVIVGAVNKAGGINADLFGYPRAVLSKAVVDFNDGVAKGDYVGHPFRGNQWSDSSGATTGGAGGSSLGAAGRMKHRRASDQDIAGTGKQGYVTTTRRALTEEFGEPVISIGPNSDGKVTVEWQTKFSDGTVATIYDWKREEPGVPGLDEEMEYNIGGKTNRAVEHVTSLVPSTSDGEGAAEDKALEAELKSRARSDEEQRQNGKQSVPGSGKLNYSARSIKEALGVSDADAQAIDDLATGRNDHVDWSEASNSSIRRHYTELAGELRAKGTLPSVTGQKKERRSAANTQAARFATMSQDAEIALNRARTEQNDMAKIAREATKAQNDAMSAQGAAHRNWVRAIEERFGQDAIDDSEHRFNIADYNTRGAVQVRIKAEQDYLTAKGATDLAVQIMDATNGRLIANTVTTTKLDEAGVSNG